MKAIMPKSSIISNCGIVMANRSGQYRLGGYYSGVYGAKLNAAENISSAAA